MTEDRTPADWRKLDFVLTVDGKDRRIDVKRISAAIVGEVAVGYLLDVESIIRNGVMQQQLGLIDTAALMFIGDRLAGINTEPGAYRDTVTYGSDVSVTLAEGVVPSFDLDADPEA